MKKRKGARLGQHFLKNAAYARMLAHAAQINAGDTVLEIGPGKGMLTKALLETGACVVAVEKDPQLADVLRGRFPAEIARNELRIIVGDVRNVVIERKGGKTASDARRGESGAGGVSNDTTSATQRLRNDADDVVLPADYAVAANIPYYITGEIIRRFLTAQNQPRTMALLVQKEVAERIVSRKKKVESSPKESILSLSVKAYGDPKIAATVSRRHFSPPPSVDSAILVVENISKKFFDDISEEGFFGVVRAGFASKRKFLLRNLAVSFPACAEASAGRQLSAVREAFNACEIPEQARAENVSIDQWKCLTKLLKAEA